MLISTSMFKTRKLSLLGPLSVGYRRPDSLMALTLAGLPNLIADIDSLTLQPHLSPGRGSPCKTASSARVSLGKVVFPSL